MEITKILDIENDGKLNMVVYGQYLYIRCKLDLYKYDLIDMKLAARNTVFKRDGKSRGFAIFGDLIFLYDFLDLYVLSKDDLRVLEIVRLGADLSSDVGGVLWYDAPRAYVKIRNGRIYALHINTKEIIKYDIADSSFWAHCLVGKSLYAGTVKGDLIEIDKEELRVQRQTSLGRMNLYSVVCHDGMIYTISQDQSIKAIDATPFDTVRVARKAARGMSAILGIDRENLVVADSGQISLWDLETLQQRARFDFPVGWNNAGVILSGNTLFGIDNQSIYRADLP